MIKHNVYFNGAVQSLGFRTTEGRVTVGVMTAGEYTFSADAKERVVVVTGQIDVRLSGSTWRTVPQGAEYVVQAGDTFAVRVASSASYICYFG